MDEEGFRVFGVPPEARAGPARYAGPHGPPAGAGPSADLRQEGRAGALGQAIVTRLFSAGLHLHSALALTADGPVAQRLSAAVADIDEAIIDLRHLMLAVLGPSAGADPDGERSDQDSRAE